MDGAGERDAVLGRVKELETWLANSTSEHDRVRLRRRIALLTGRIAILEVGGATPLEVAERRGRAHDAVSAAQAAMEEGVVPGGGVALLRTVDCLKDLAGGNHAERRGIEIVEEALKAPLLTIAENAGYDPAETLSRVLAESHDFGLDAETGHFGSLSEAGILDPLKVVRSALQNAASIGALILTTETLVAERPEDGEERRKEA
ncbi:MAG: TCP-1/cpn60 chaperonin family protein [Candidatus Eisenbacteria bacterium]